MGHTHTHTCRGTHGIKTTHKTTHHMYRQNEALKTHATKQNNGVHDQTYEYCSSCNNAVCCFGSLTSVFAHICVHSHLCSLTSVFTHICVHSHLCSLQLVCWAKVTQEECLPELCCITIICSTGTMSSFTQLKIGIFSLFYETDCWLFIITLCHSTSPNGPTVLGSGWSSYRMEQFLAFPEKTGSMSRDTLVYVDNKTVFHLGV